MSRGRLAVSTLALCGMLLAALPALAGARTAYVTGGNSPGPVPYAVPVDLPTETPGAEIDLGGFEATPARVAITPDGATAYVPNPGEGEVVPIDVATNTAGASIPVDFPWGVAITADGSRLYVSDQNGEVYAFDVATNAPVAGWPVAVGFLSRAIAVTPDGAFVYVANEADDTVSVIDTARAAVASTITVGNGPQGVAVTPDGAFVYVANAFSDDVSVIDVRTNTVVTTIPGAGGTAIAITPDGSRAYTVDGSGNGAAIDLATNTAGSPFSIVAGNFLSDVAILPDGSAAYATSDGNANVGLAPIDLATDTAGTVFPVGSSPSGIAIVPNQGPRASFSSVPVPEAVPDAGASAQTSSSSVRAYDFNATGSTDSDGTVTRYDWDFGDGTTALNAGPTPIHTFPGPGTYTVALTVTDNEGCSLEIVFTGQTAYCNGSELARTTRTVTIEPSVRRCPKIVGRAKTFVPKIVPGRVVPGVRVRLAANQPVFVKVRGTLIWNKNGAKHRTKLGRAGGKLNRWRRIRFPLPRALRDALPLGTKVKVRLRIRVTPRRMRKVCGGRTITKTLWVRVKKVFPNRVQRGRIP